MEGKIGIFPLIWKASENLQQRDDATCVVVRKKGCWRENEGECGPMGGGTRRKREKSEDHRIQNDPVLTRTFFR